MVYQIDSGCRRRLWVGQRRTQATPQKGLAALGPEVVKGLRFVCSDIWKPYLAVIAEQASQALHVLDRFHITMHLNQAVDQVRRGESTRSRAAGKKERLKHMRWTLLRRGSRVRGRARQKLQSLLCSKLATARAGELKETFHHFWTYKSLLWARTFLDYWCYRAMRSRLEPMKKVARMLRAHEELLLNWFRAKGEISSGAVEGLKQQNPSGNQKILWVPHLSSYGNCALPYAWPTTRASMDAQILLRRQKCLPYLPKMLISADNPISRGKGGGTGIHQLLHSCHVHVITL